MSCNYSINLYHAENNNMQTGNNNMQIENNNKTMDFRDYKSFFTHCKTGNLEAVKDCIENGANINLNYDQAIKLAAKNGHVDVVTYLVKMGADPNEALVDAAFNGHIIVVQYLVLNGANVSANNNAAIKYASENGHIVVVQYLVLNGVDPNEALVPAAENGQMNIIMFLVKHGINLDVHGQDAIDMAKKNNHQYVVDYLTKIIFEIPIIDDSNQNMI